MTTDNTNKTSSLSRLLKKISSTNISKNGESIFRELLTVVNADRLTFYLVSKDNLSLISNLHLGLSAKHFKLTINKKSIAGFSASTKRLVNIKDVYDENELKKLDPGLLFMRDVDKKTGYRTKQMLVAPIINKKNGQVLGVVQIINHKKPDGFPDQTDETVKKVCEYLADNLLKNLEEKPNLAPEGFVPKEKYDHLIADGIISIDQMNEAKEAASRLRTTLEDALISEIDIDIARIGAALAKHYQVPYAPFLSTRIASPTLLKKIEQEYAEEEQWIPLEELSKDSILVMCLDPSKARSTRKVNSIFPGTKVVYQVTTEREFKKTINQLFGQGLGGADVGELLDSMEDSNANLDVEDSSDVSTSEDTEVVKLVNRIIIHAYKVNASDVHVEPGIGKDKVQIRIRKDGSLKKYIDVPAGFRNAIVARLKVMCDLDIAERRIPQDGKIKFKRFVPNLDIELRVATLPTAGGVEDVVMRILAAGEPLPLDKLGVLTENLTKLKDCVSKPYGLFFVCGPTGSGKTTTLHSILKFLNTPDRKIWTAEDPVEITQKGLRQVQVNKKTGLDFPIAMRAFLRADPDIIMVGEMRDGETTGIGIEASLTGHLVFATLHTNSAPESIVRLLDMGMDPFNFADAILGILAQRLAKRLCSCKELYHPGKNEIKSIINEYCTEMLNTVKFKEDKAKAMNETYHYLLNEYGSDGTFELYRPKGCPECDNTGYRGRIGLHELMIGTDIIKKHIQEKERVAVLFAQALEDGMLTLKMDGIQKVLQGITDMIQVRSVCIK